LQAENFCGSRLIALSAGESRRYDLAAEVVDHFVIRHTVGSSAVSFYADDGFGQIIYVNGRRLPQYDSSFDNIGKFPDIARPVVGEKLLQRGTGHIGKVLLRLLAKSLDEIPNQHWNVFFSLS
jgi:hypothetical protein